MQTRPVKGGTGGRKLPGILLFAAINIAIVAYIAYNEFGKGAVNGQSLARLHVDMSWLIFAVLCFAAAAGAETIKYRDMMIAAEGRDDLRCAFECAVLGKYYDNITPLGAGGQPFQIVYLKKRGLTTGDSAAMPIAGFLCLQFAFVLIAAAVFICNGSVAQNVAAIRISAYVGLAFYMFVPVCIIMFAFMPRAFGRLVCAAAKLLSRIHLIKDYDKAVNSIFGSLGEYADSLKAMYKFPGLLLKLMLCSVVYQAAVMSIPYFVLRAFGGTNSWWTVFSLVVFIYAAITIIPTPGNSGAAEGSFYAVFSALTVGYLIWAMLVWRLLVYYSWLIAGLGVIALSSVPSKRTPRKAPEPGAPLRAALFSDVFYPTVDGVVRTVDSYAGRLNSGGGYCCVVCPRGTGQYKDAYSYDVMRTRAFRLPGLSYLIPAPDFTPGLRRFFKENSFDVFHAHSPFLAGGFAVRTGRRLGVPVVATFHSKFYDDALNITRSRLAARLVTKYVVGFFCRVDEVWACSAAAADTLRAYGFAGKIKVMENGVDIPRDPDCEAEKTRAASEFGISGRRRVMLFVGQLIWHKNLRLILDTAKLLKDAGGGYYTVIAGSGYDGEAVKQYAADLELADCVLFTGQINDRALLRGLYAACSLLFFPSVYDNAPLVVREAALAGLPALLAAGSNSAESVTDGFNGYTCECSAEKMAEKIAVIFSDEASLAAAGENARKTIPVSWDEIVSRAADEYRGVRKRSHEALDMRSAQAELEGKLNKI